MFEHYQSCWQDYDTSHGGELLVMYLLIKIDRYDIAYTLRALETTALDLRT